MITVEKSKNGNTDLLRLSGYIDENVNFAQILGSPTSEMEINCKGITRINSIGVKEWIKYFQSCLAAGTKLRFIECSTSIVEQINLILNFTCGGKVESLYVPFSCPSCKSELTILFKSKELKKIKFNLPEVKCQKCSGIAVFDDIAEEYFGFLER